MLALKTKLLPLEQVLRRFWNLNKFEVKSHAKTSASQPEDWEANTHKLDKAIRDPLFWVQSKLIFQIGLVGEWLGRFAEGCTCHEDELLAGITVQCDWKQCRSPEMSCGDGIARLECRLRHFHTLIAPICSNPEIGKEDRQQFFLLASKVSSGILAELRLKFGHYGQLPLLLCGLGHHDTSKACWAARRSLELFDGVSFASLHTMSKRFLDPNWNFQGEGPLRPCVERMAAGECFASVASSNAAFQHWVTGLRSIKLVERSVEGLHSRIRKATRTAPNQSMSFLSCDLRFHSLLKLVTGHPELLNECHDDIISLERSGGFQRGVAAHLNLALAPATDRECSNLLYRENLRVKHSKKTKTIKEVLKSSRLAPSAVGQSHAPTADAETKILGDHLAELVMGNPNIMFSIPDEVFQKCCIPLDEVAQGHMAIHIAFGLWVVFVLLPNVVPNFVFDIIMVLYFLLVLLVICHLSVKFMTVIFCHCRL